MASYPAFPTLSGQKITVDWLMNNPVVIHRAIRTLAQQRLIGDRLLTGRVDLTGSGSVIFGVSEGLFPSRSAERIAPNGEYPLTDDGPEVPAAANTDKWGLSTEVPQELIARNRLDVVQRKIVKLTNQVVFQFDALVLSAIASAVTQTQAASAAWNTANADPFLDMMLAGAVSDTLNQGYEIDVVALSPTYFARAVAAAKIIERMPREGSDSLIITGRMIRVAGMTFLKSTNLPPGVNVMVADSTQLGSIATERIGGPGWTGTPEVVETKVEPMQGVDGYRIYCRKVAVPMVQEPGAAVKLTGA